MQWFLAAAGLFGPARYLFALMLGTLLALNAGESISAQTNSEFSRTVSYDFQLKIEDVDDLPRKISGHLTIRNWQAEQGYCLFLPYNWHDYGTDRGAIKRFNDITSQRNKPEYSGGQTTLALSGAPKIEDTGSPHLIRLNVPKGWNGDDIVLQLESVAPKLPDAAHNEFILDGFLPVITNCNRPEMSQLSEKVVDYSGKIEIPPHWQFAGSGQLRSSNIIDISANGRGLAFALSRGMKRYATKSQNLPIEVVYSSDYFPGIADTIITTLPIIESMIGPYPFRMVTIVESDELQRSSIPELIAVNKPGQAFANKIQRDWLNWMHWTAVTQLIRQWYGASINTSEEDEWLISGIVEFLALEVLQQIPARFNLFKSGEDGERLISLDYLQMSEFTAASLRRLSPFTVLTDGERKSLDTSTRQHGLSYIRHAFAMRQIKHNVGAREFFSFMRAITAAFMNEQITPGQFFDFTQKLPSPFSPTKREEIAASLMSWWTDFGWPDFSIVDFEVSNRNGRYESSVIVEQEGSIDFPPIIAVTDDDGGTEQTRAEGTAEGKWRAAFSTQFKPKKALVDPTHETFDANRFNNKTGFSGVEFFPGPGKTIHDDKYTVIWLPYGYRLPGEPATIGIGSAVFKYLQSGLLARIEYAPATEQAAYQIRQLYALSDWALRGELSMSYSFDRDRLIELTTVRSPIIPTRTVNISSQIKARYKDHPGEPDLAHHTFAADLTAKPKGTNLPYYYNVAIDGEISPEQGRGFSYKRYFSLLRGSLEIAERVDFGLRLFRGRTDYKGQAPQTALFKPNEVKEANLKVDIQGLERSADLVSIEASVSLPFFLPLPRDSLILTRQMQWRIYYDWGEAYDLDQEYHSRGVGIMMPMGGDISGVGSLAVTRFTFLAILNSAAGSKERKKPGFVFDISGQL